MAQYQGIVKGQSQFVSRIGNKRSGLRVEANGWDCGISVRVAWNEEKERDEFYVYLTGGSNEYSPPRLIGRYSEEDL